MQALAKTAAPRDELVLPTTGLSVIEAPFEKRYNATVASGELAGHITIVPNNQRTLAELALALFNHTHDFFALHMVTGTHVLGASAPTPST